MSKKEMRIINIAGYDVEMHSFGKRSFYYPSFNGNVEFPVNSKGLRALSSYLRTCRYFKDKEIEIKK